MLEEMETLNRLFFTTIIASVDNLYSNQSLISPPRRNCDPPAGLVGGEAAGAGPLPGQAAGPGATAPP
jgi:hypothetical protein